MTQVGDIFDGLLANLRVDNDASFALRRDEITKVLNRDFRGLEGSTNHKLMVVSYGRWTAIKGISDLDMLFILPSSLRDSFSSASGPSRVLARTRKAIQARYPNTSVTVDRLVVVVQFGNFMFEVQPVFENTDGSFSYPDTKTGSWKVTKPREEIEAMRSEDLATHGTVRHLCKIARAWKNKHGVVMGGLLIDTLAYNFISSSTDYVSVSSSSYGDMARDFFLFLADEPDKERYSALGSHQHVRVKKKFQRKARKAYDLSLEAIDAAGQKNEYKKWRAVFGKPVPIVGAAAALTASASFDDTEEFIEDMFPVDIRFDLRIDCKVTQDGFRPTFLRNILARAQSLPAKKDLLFQLVSTDVVPPYEVRWKVLNRGAEAERRNRVRGQIIEPNSGKNRREHTDFSGRHLVECFVIKGGVVVARDDLEVPISNQ